MNTSNFDALTRMASRRGSLLALGGAGLSAMTGAFGAAAKPKAGKLARKKCRNKCKAQVGQCDLAFNLSCSLADDPEACKAAVLPCCDFLGTCNAGGMLACFAAVEF